MNTSPGDEPSPDCRQCYFRQVPETNDAFFLNAVRPYCWIAAVLLFSSYVIGLLFTLRTHAAVIWSTDIDEKKPQLPTTSEVSPFDTRHQSTANLRNALSTLGSPTMNKGTIRESQLYKRILGQSLKQVGLSATGQDGDSEYASRAGSQLHGSEEHQPKQQQEGGLPYVVPPKSSAGETLRSESPRNITVISGLSDEDNTNLVRQVAEMAAMTATVAARDVTRGSRRGSNPRSVEHGVLDASKQQRPSNARVGTFDHSGANAAAEQAVHAESGGHDAPNWSRTKSYVILLTATLAYAMVAEVLVNTVDVVLQNVDIDEKFLGITLFALVPNTTEFLNGISFAMNGNIALSIEIGSAYALQVSLLQIPTLVLYSAVVGRWTDVEDMIDHTFNLIFPQWDMVTVILCVFLLSYMMNEGKSNYFKGSILVMTYIVVIMGFYYSGFTSMSDMGVDPNDTLAMSYRYMLEGSTRITTPSRREL